MVLGARLREAVDGVDVRSGGVEEVGEGEEHGGAELDGGDVKEAVVSELVVPGRNDDWRRRFRCFFRGDYLKLEVSVSMFVSVSDRLSVVGFEM